MFGILDDFIDNPLGTTANIVTQPLRDAVSVVEGLSEGELRADAILRLGVDVGLGMGYSELVEWHNNL